MAMPKVDPSGNWGKKRAHSTAAKRRSLHEYGCHTSNRMGYRSSPRSRVREDRAVRTILPFQDISGEQPWVGPTMTLLERITMTSRGDQSQLAYCCA